MAGRPRVRLITGDYDLADDRRYNAIGIQRAKEATPHATEVQTQRPGSRIDRTDGHRSNSIRLECPKATTPRATKSQPERPGPRAMCPVCACPLNEQNTTIHVARVHGRLYNLDLELARGLGAASRIRQRRIAEFAAQWAVTRTGLSHRALASDSVKAVEALVGKLNHRYSTLSGGHTGRADLESAGVVFGQARAASAVEYMLRGEVAEVVYESASATADWSELRAIVLSLLQAKQLSKTLASYQSVITGSRP